MTLAQQIAVAIEDIAPSEPARAVMRQSLYDWMCCGITGADEPVSRIVRSQAMADGGTATARLFGGGSAPSRAAALVNGATSHALDYDDTHFAHVGHPSVAVLPAVFGLGAGTGEACLEAALIGSEVSVRMGLWLGRTHYQAGFHMTATAGAVGATAAVARLRGLDAETTAHALNIASTKAAGLKSQFGSMGKPLNAGLAAECGVVAADLAARGFVAGGEGLDGPQGMGSTQHGEADASAFHGFGTIWHMEQVSHKVHACCHGLHAMISALASLDINADTVDRITIHTNPRWLTVCNIADPVSGLETKFSYRHVAAMVVAGRDTSGIASFSDANAKDSALQNLRQKVSVIADGALPDTATRVVARLTDGSSHSADHDLSDPIPMDKKWQMLRQKGRALVGNRESLLFDAVDYRVNADALKDLMG